jgi:hypothetical protein
MDSLSQDTSWAQDVVVVPLEEEELKQRREHTKAKILKMLKDAEVEDKARREVLRVAQEKRKTAAQKEKKKNSRG